MLGIAGEVRMNLLVTFSYELQHMDTPKLILINLMRTLDVI